MSTGSTRGGHQHILAAAEAYAREYRDDPKALQRWAEAAPPPVRALFLAIRENTPGARPRDPANAGPYRYNPEIPRLSDFSAELRALLELSWPVWEGEG